MAGAPTVGSIFGQRIVIGVGDSAVSNLQQMTLSTFALGSCVGVVVYDPSVRVGGILHIMLPNSSISPEKAQAQPAMFADTGLPMFFKALISLKAERQKMLVFIAGGACVLQGRDAFKIGERNGDAVNKFLKANGYFIAGGDIGGSINRTLHLEIGTGNVTMKTPLNTEEFTLQN